MSESIRKDIASQNPHEKQGAARFKDILQKDWDSIIVDIGCNGRASTIAERGTLMLLIDPHMGDGKINWGANHMEPGSKVIKIKKEARDVSKYLQNKVDRVQIIAPDPDQFWGMFDESFGMVKLDGEIVVLLDTVSNKQEGVSRILDDLILEDFPGYDKEVFYPGEADIDELVEGEVNSDFILHPAYAVVLTRRY